MIIYFILRFFLVISLFISGYNIQKKGLSGRFKYPYWNAASLCLIVYSLVEGLRYGRATDYFSYKKYFENPLSIKYDHLEFLFLFFCRSVQDFSVPYFISFLFFSFLLVYSILTLLKQHRKVAFWALPLFFLETFIQSENLLRQYAAFSLFILFIYFFNNKKKYVAFLLILSAFFTHYSIIILFPFFLWFNYFKNPFRNVILILLIYIISIILIPSMEQVSILLDYFSKFNLYSNLLNNKNRWLFGEGLDAIKIYQFDIIYYIRMYFRPFLILGIGYKLINKYHKINFGLFYHFYFIGVIFTPLSLSAPMELIYRLVLYFKTFGFLVLAYLIYDSITNFKSLNIYIKIGVKILILDSIYMLLKSIFTYDEKLGFLFIWDIN